jgi:NADPH:quinone reductase-like Zn-dependent oxidoreductase
MRQYFLGLKDGQPHLELRDVPKPEPKEGQILLKVKATALNRGEFVVGHGLALKSGGAAKPAGIEAAGEVVAVGPGVEGWKIGDHCMSRASGAFADYALILDKDAMKKPEALSWEEAGCASLVFLTAHDMLVVGGGLKAGEWVLITGASSGVGVASLLIAKALGAKVIGTSGSAAKLEALKRHGLDHGIVARGNLPVDEVKKVTGGHGVDIVINNVGGTMFAPCIETLAYKGRLATVGYVDGVVEAKIDLAKLHADRLVLYGVSNKNRGAAERFVHVAAFRRDILPLFAAGKLEPIIDRVFPFADIAAAQARMLSDAQIGKIVVTL